MFVPDKSNSMEKVEQSIGLLQKTFECPICLEVMINAVSTKCDHKFCRLCISETLGHKGTVPCPLCKVPVTKRSLQKLPRWNKIVNKVRDLIAAFQRDTGMQLSPPAGFHMPLSQGSPMISSKRQSVTPYGQKRESTDDADDLLVFVDDDIETEPVPMVKSHMNQSSPFGQRSGKRRRLRGDGEENQAPIDPDANADTNRINNTDDGFTLFSDPVTMPAPATSPKKMKKSSSRKTRASISKLGKKRKNLIEHDGKKKVSNSRGLRSGRTAVEIVNLEVANAECDEATPKGKVKNWLAHYPDSVSSLEVTPLREVPVDDGDTRHEECNEEVMRQEDPVPDNDVLKTLTSKGSQEHDKAADVDADRQTAQIERECLQEEPIQATSSPVMKTQLPSKSSPRIFRSRKKKNPSESVNHLKESRAVQPAHDPYSFIPSQKSPDKTVKQKKGQKMGKKREYEVIVFESPKSKRLERSSLENQDISKSKVKKSPSDRSVVRGVAEEASSLTEIQEIAEKISEAETFDLMLSQQFRSMEAEEQLKAARKPGPNESTQTQNNGHTKPGKTSHSTSNLSAADNHDQYIEMTNEPTLKSDRDQERDPDGVAEEGRAVAKKHPKRSTSQEWASTKGMKKDLIPKTKIKKNLELKKGSKKKHGAVTLDHVERASNHDDSDTDDMGIDSPASLLYEAPNLDIQPDDVKRRLSQLNPSHATRSRTTPRSTPLRSTPSKHTPSKSTLSEHTPSKSTPTGTPSKGTPKLTPLRDTPRTTPLKDTPQTTPLRDSPGTTPLRDTPRMTRSKTTSSRIKSSQAPSVSDQSQLVVPESTLNDNQATIMTVIPSQNSVSHYASSSDDDRDITSPPSTPYAPKPQRRTFMLCAKSPDVKSPTVAAYPETIDIDNIIAETTELIELAKGETESTEVNSLSTELLVQEPLNVKVIEKRSQNVEDDWNDGDDEVVSATTGASSEADRHAGVLIPLRRVTPPLTDSPSVDPQILTDSDVRNIIAEGGDIMRVSAASDKDNAVDLCGNDDDVPNVGDKSKVNSILPAESGGFIRETNATASHNMQADCNNIHSDLEGERASVVDCANEPQETDHNVKPDVSHHNVHIDGSDEEQHRETCLIDENSLDKPETAKEEEKAHCQRVNVHQENETEEADDSEVTIDVTRRKTTTDLRIKTDSLVSEGDAFADGHVDFWADSQRSSQKLSSPRRSYSRRRKSLRTKTFDELSLQSPCQTPRSESQVVTRRRSQRISLSGTCSNSLTQSPIPRHNASDSSHTQAITTYRQSFDLFREDVEQLEETNTGEPEQNTLLGNTEPVAMQTNTDVTQESESILGPKLSPIKRRPLHDDTKLDEIIEHLKGSGKKKAADAAGVKCHYTALSSDSEEDEEPIKGQGLVSKGDKVTRMKSSDSMIPAPISDNDTPLTKLKGRPKRPVIEDSSDDDGIVLMNQTSSSAYSSQSEVIDSQHKFEVEEDCLELKAEIALWEARLAAEKTSTARHKSLPSLTPCPSPSSSQYSHDLSNESVVRTRRSKLRHKQVRNRIESDDSLESDDGDEAVITHVDSPPSPSKATRSSQRLRHQTRSSQRWRKGSLQMSHGSSNKKSCVKKLERNDSVKLDGSHSLVVIPDSTGAVTETMSDDATLDLPPCASGTSVRSVRSTHSDGDLFDDEAHDVGTELSPIKPNRTPLKSLVFNNTNCTTVSETLRSPRREKLSEPKNNKISFGKTCTQFSAERYDVVEPSATVEPTGPDQVVTSLEKVKVEDSPESAPFPAQPEWSIVTSGLRKNQQHVVTELCGLLGCSFTQRFSPKTTHVLLKPAVEGSLTCMRTLKYFQGIAARVWVLSSQWAMDCIDQGKLLPEDDYEIQGDNVEHGDHFGPQNARLSTTPLLHVFAICCLGTFTDLTRDDLGHLVEDCGGRYVGIPAKFSSLEPVLQRIIVVESVSSLKADQLLRIQKQHKAKVVIKEWLLDSIGMYDVRPLDLYTVPM